MSKYSFKQWDVKNLWLARACVYAQVTEQRINNKIFFYYQCYDTARFAYQNLANYI